MTDHSKYTPLLEASFDAALLVEASRKKKKKKKGTILLANAAAYELFATEHLSGQCVDEIISFWLRQDGAVDAVSWDQVLLHDDMREWPICGKRNDSSHMFSGTLRLAPIDGDDNLWLAILRRSAEPSSKSCQQNGTTKKENNNQEEQALEMVEAALDPMFQIDQDGIILMVNQAACTCFQYDRHELVGANVSILCGGKHGPLHDSYLQKYLETGETHVIGQYRELSAHRKDGTEFPILLGVVELKTSSSQKRLFCGFIHDLTARRRNEDIIFGTIDTSLDPVFHINELCIIKNINLAAVQHLGWEWDELLGQNVNVVVGRDHAKQHDQYIQRYLKTGEAKAIGKRRHVHARRRDGSEIPIELQLSEIKLSDGRERMFCAIMTLL